MTENKVLFTWESHYLVQQAISYRKTNFQKKFWDQWIHSFSSDAIDISTIQSALLWWWFFSAKNLIIIYGLPKEKDSARKIETNTAEKLEEFLIKNRDWIPNDNFLLLVSYKPDKRTKSYKFFSSHCTIKSYPKKKWKDLTMFVLDKTKLQDWNNTTQLLETQDANYLVSIVWDDLHNLHHECEKLLYYAKYHKLLKLSFEDIKKVVYSQAWFDIFKILDKLFIDPKKAIELISEAQSKWQNEFEFLWMIYRGLKMILWMLELKKEWVWSSKQAASILKLHPFAAAKQRSKIEVYTTYEQKISTLYTKILQLDMSIKTWSFPQEWFRLRIKSQLHEFVDPTVSIS